MSKARFVASLVLITIGFGFWMVPHWRTAHGLAYCIGYLFVLLSGLIANPRARASLHRPMRLPDFVGLFLVWAGLAAVAILGHYFLSDRALESIDRIVSHPAFLILLWAVFVWLYCRRWKRRPYISIGPPLVYPATLSARAPANN